MRAPMLATLADAPLVDERLAYEPKYDGIRALIELEPRRGPAGVRIWSRLGNDKTGQFADLVEVLARFGRTLERRVLLDGEIAALDEQGEPTGFQRLQGRIHGTRAGERVRQPVAFIAFDILEDGDEDLTRLPLMARRARLERVLGNSGSEAFRLSRFVAGDGRELHREALARGWEGLIVKRLDAPYASGRRSPDWKKLKLVGRQECVVGGWTEPRESRAHFGALLLGVYDRGALEYVGHTGTGFTHAELARLAALMRPLETPSCPFRERPRTNERAHWIRPEIVVEVKFSEWTRDGKLRAPVYLGVRDDVPPGRVGREPFARRDSRVFPSGAAIAEDRMGPARSIAEPLERLIATLQDLEERGADGVLTLPDGHTLEVTNLRKVLWPGLGITKGELMRYDVRVADLILPAVADRPLVMKRLPNGIGGKAFYQQRAPDDVPAGVRVEVLPTDTEVPSRLVGGSLVTLLYMTQLAAISQDPWFSRVGSPEFADHVALDLDPMPGVPFTRVLDVARWLRDELDRLAVPSVPKTSGSEGVHIYVPLPPRTTYESGRLFCQIVATLIADRHPEAATVERAVHGRGRTVYIDYLQNIRGKTLATAYSARASEFAGVSTPLTWDEVERGVDRRDFTLRTVPARVATVGDLWAPVRTSPGADLGAVLRYADRALTSSTPSTRARSTPARSASAAARPPSARTPRPRRRPSPS